MRRAFDRLISLVRDRSGATMLEYALIVALLAAALSGIVLSLEARHGGPAFVAESQHMNADSGMDLG